MGLYQISTKFKTHTCDCEEDSQRSNAGLRSKIESLLRDYIGLVAAYIEKIQTLTLTLMEILQISTKRKTHTCDCEDGSQLCNAGLRSKIESLLRDYIGLVDTNIKNFKVI